MLDAAASCKVNIVYGKIKLLYFHLYNIDTNKKLKSQINVTQK